MKIEQLETRRLLVRQYGEDDLEVCRRFRREVFGLDEPEAGASAWLKWTIDSYRELAALGQPPYADYAVVLRDSGEFIGSAGIVPTIVPWGALKGDPSDTLLSPRSDCFGAYCPRIAGAASRRRRPARFSNTSSMNWARGMPWRPASATTLLHSALWRG